MDEKTAGVDFTNESERTRQPVEAAQAKEPGPSAPATRRFPIRIVRGDEFPGALRRSWVACDEFAMPSRAPVAGIRWQRE